MAKHQRTITRRTKLTAAITAVAAAAGVTLFGTSFAGAAPVPMGTVYGADAETAVSGSYIVMLGEKADKSKLAKEYGGKLQRNYSSSINGFSASGLSETEAKRLAADPAVAKVVQNKKFSINATQENPPSWGLDRVDQTETAGDNAYNYPDTAGEGVTAYVIDTGVRVTHEDFEGRATSGFDAVDNDDDADDGNGHGTHVAGTIAGASHGVAKKAKIVAVRVLDDNGSGTTEQVIAGIDWVAANASGPSVANMSLGGGADPALDAAVQKAIAAGVTFGVAAGNESSDAGQVSPARVPEAITVASSTEADEQSSFSNYGSIVDIYAPGSDITSTWNDSDTGTNTISGTSMATPHVVGAAAVYLAGNPDATPDAVATALTEGATPDAISNATEGTANKLLKIVE
ncbi:MULTISPECIES: S8 family peptidase [unclassified Streptomyces]|uniref:S8 family peptidase n=1 Tax=unclassified Streptomyces TaxID=2593676 RepID=UPI000823A5A9|nr:MULTISPECIES: S8 family peptidase [unclassified Streptomyces]MYU01624.1 S8 family serine peptidase [Streptomyces sp. SID8350]SCK26817.1 Subtilisin-like serine proteases [Streptomyces sp. AmelKG-D3]